MDTLPDEVLIYIFDFFNIKSRITLFQVCMRWRRIILNTSKLNSFFIMNQPTDMEFLKAWPQSVDIKTLIVDLHVDLINTFLEELGETCPNLRSLTISKCNLLSERHVHRLSKCFPLLESIDIFLTSFYIPSWYLKILDNMKVIVLNNRLDDSTLKIISEKCTKLKELHMYGYVKFYPMCHLQNLLYARCDTLTKLTLRCCEFNDKTCILLANCINLHKLYMYNCWLITDVGLECLSSFKYLKCLHMTGLKLITKNGFAKFLDDLNMDAITELNFSCSPFNDNHALLMAKKKMYLQTLELWNCAKLTDQGINYLLDVFKELNTLDISLILKDDTFRRIILDTKIVFLRFNNCTTDIMKMWKLLQYRRIEIEGVSLASDEVHYRGSAEGFRANFMSYSSQFKHS